MAEYQGEPIDEQVGAEETPAETQAEIGPSKDFKRWKQRISSAKKLRRDWEREFQVETCEDFYLGKQQKGLPPGTKVINHFLATINTTIPGLLFDAPRFLARPKPGTSAPVSKEQAKIAEGVLENVAKKENNLESAAKLGLLQNFWRIGVLKCIYDPALEPNPKAGNPIYSTDSAGNVIFDQATQQPTPEMDPLTGQPMMEPDMVMSDETYRWEWVDARHMLLPDDGPDMAKWSWIGEQIEVPLEDAKEDERFSPELRVRFTDSGKAEGEEGSTTSDSDKEGYEACFRYTECYDIKKKKWYIIAECGDIDEFLLEQPFPDGIDDHPYAVLPGWLPNTGPKPSPWPLPYTNPWIHLQQEYNIRRLQMMEGAKRSARKILYEKSTFEDADEATKALASNKDMEAVMINDIMRPPVPMMENPLNPSITNDVPALLMDWRIITGQTGQKMGVPDSNTATEATFVERASNLRDAEIQKAVVRWLECAGQKMWQLVKATLTLKLFVKIRGMNDNSVKALMQARYGIPPQALDLFPSLAEQIVQKFGDETLQPVSREDLTFEADISVIPGSTKPRNLTVERQQFIEFLTLVANAPQIALSPRLLEETAAKFDFIDPAMVEEVHAMAVMMIKIKAQQAGHGGGGEQNQAPGESAKNGNQSQASQGTELA